MRIERKLRPLRQYSSMSAPRYLASFRAHALLERILPHRNRRRTVKCRKSDKDIRAPYRLFKIFPERFPDHML